MTEESAPTTQEAAGAGAEAVAGDDTADLETVEIIRGEVEEDGTVVIDDLVLEVDAAGHIIASDERIEIDMPDGTVIVDETFSVANADGELEEIEEDTVIITPDESDAGAPTAATGAAEGA